ncbi:Uncharacterised protein [Legionella lansingensis]|uniref:Uncharacterized protein n=1 Tax=Legionella lansingensis TaxID=45067 RepID=A0A0W0V7B5_9GAMM|nr:hypothetical protein Llan_2566 [Legionella lansingensis]SNV56538.1 Uncharacterised protein [Legionella lansingensis]
MLKDLICEPGKYCFYYYRSSGRFGLRFKYLPLEKLTPVNPSYNAAVLVNI